MSYSKYLCYFDNNNNNNKLKKDKTNGMFLL